MKWHRLLVLALSLICLLAMPRAFGDEKKDDPKKQKPPAEQNAPRANTQATAASAPAPDEDIALSREEIEALTGLHAPSKISEPAASAPEQDRVAPSPKVIKAANGPAAPNAIKPPDAVPAQDQDVPLAADSEAAILREESPRVFQLDDPAVKPSAGHVHRTIVVVAPKLIAESEPSAVYRVDGQYAVWNRGSAQGVRIGDEVKLLHEEKQIGRGQVIAVRVNDCDLEIAETYEIASVAVGDRVKLLPRATTP